ncbi:flavin-binding monooxygenase-like protein-like protein [Massariosphaeria phaeospora]|uniref:Flavin-binding monooxygenase-like protein-like protein n=1 Tax=Massariosphaeria phaeospora TaxID=100035 RepID=A0A7C8HZ29_9PLEO|nr:flavin-binding monooxygenase-like protein-like protein [Massariosphaeria phaeospora]
MLKTYGDANPGATKLVLDKGSFLGGVWARDRLYPGLRTNNHFKTFEYSDSPMSTEGYDPQNDHIPGEHVNEYLLDYVNKYNLIRHIRFNSSVESAIDNGDAGWTLVVADTKRPQREIVKIRARKLVLATGLTAEPFMPSLEGRETFSTPIYHSSEFAKAEDGPGQYKKVVLLSGAKFSWDIACAYASAGVHVDWIIRESGHGPCWMMPNRLTPLKVIPELLLTTRLITWLSPTIWDSDGFTSIRSFFQRHWLGRKIVDGFFAKIQHSVLEHNDYDAHPETAKLKPWDDLFFIGTNRGLFNYGLDFFELVRNGTISVHIADISRLSEHTVHLSNGESLDADVLIFGTGWKDAPQLRFVTERELGLPGFASPSANRFIAKADAEILEKCPKLKDQPEPREVKPMTDDATELAKEPYRLYRFMVPPAFIASRTLAFAGAYRSPATTIIAQVQALWITAFLDNQLPALHTATTKPPSNDMSKPTNGTLADGNTTSTDLNDPANRILYETVLHTQFGKWRYSRGFGARFPELWFDCLPYVDLLLRDVGVQNRRKGSWWGERFTPYWPKDYRGIVDEYLELRDGRARERGDRRAECKKQK